MQTIVPLPPKINENDTRKKNITKKNKEFNQVAIIPVRFFALLLKRNRISGGGASVVPVAGSERVRLLGGSLCSAGCWE